MTTNNLRFVTTPHSGVEERKKGLRAYMKGRRAENENRDVKASLATENLLEFLKKDGAGTKRKVFVYLSFSSELATDGMIERLQEEGYEVYCPRLEKGEMLAVEYGKDFTLSKLGIREPLGEILNAAPDVVITPLLAVDNEGNRLGYGGGYYDRYFEKYPTAKRIGFCFDFQIVNTIPHTQEDKRLDAIVTDKQTILCACEK